eukprot:gnl/TRDRNA2_/TRDRNA2_176924_c7_seq4.p1 gnl/TRDRNA2_/TRDRNA2_176924_c7~~gnl/TRDRNA2_/TRDRNA2_176924_c7_seq4.p1  ORF type:complete len:231 (+),score=18.87 gnl/TRDRNA2_/TRDRNA2_176924_c7_seq4:61-693(+)
MFSAVSCARIKQIESKEPDQTGGWPAFQNFLWHAASGDVYPTCNCGCCIVQDRGDAVSWGRAGDDRVNWACGPVYHSQHFFHEGFAECNELLGIDGNFCIRQSDDPLLSAAERQVDITRFCFYECQPSYASIDEIAPGGECIPATDKAIDDANALSPYAPTKNQPTLPNGVVSKASIGGGIDLGKANYGMKAHASFMQKSERIRSTLRRR